MFNRLSHPEESVRVLPEFLLLRLAVLEVLTIRRKLRGEVRCNPGRLVAGVFGSLDTNPCSSSSTTHGHHHRPGQNQDRTSLIDNDIALPSINISDGTPFQNDIETAFFNVPCPPGYSHSCTDIDASGTFDSEIAPLSPKTLQTLDCYGYDVGVDVDIEWPLVSAVDASA